MREDNKALVRRLYDEVWSEGKLDKIDQFYAPDHIQHNPLPGEQERGLAQMKASLQRLFAAFQKLSVEINLMMARGDEVIAVLTVRGFHGGKYEELEATNRAFAMAAVVIHRIVKGKIVETWQSRDEEGLLRQLRQ